MTETHERFGTTYEEYLDADTHPVDDILRAASPMPPGNTRVPTSVYTSKAFHDLEVEKLWSRVWQLACLEEEVPNVGDHHVYDIANLSFLIVRTEDGLKAYRNACLHRGRQLKDHAGKGAASLRCSFHGWHWSLDGQLLEIPAHWDFPSVRAEDYCLDEALIDTWHGFVFINPDLNAAPLADHLEGLDEHFAKLPFEQRVKTAHVRKIMRCNWKTCQEAFMESYHVIATHPTLALRIGDSNSRYDVYKNFSRAISPGAVESPHLANLPTREQLADGKMFTKWVHPFSGHTYERVDLGVVRVTKPDGTAGTFDENGRWIDGTLTQADPQLCKWIGGELLAGMEEMPLPPDAPDGVDGRAWLAEATRRGLRDKHGDQLDLEAFSDSEMVDSMYYSVFPNWSPWGSFNRLFYRFRPNGDNHEECIFEVMMFDPAPDPDNRPPLPKVTELGPDDDWAMAPELGYTVKIFQQDSFNLPMVQRGLHSQGRGEIVLGAVNETKIRHFYEQLFAQLEIGEVSVTLEPPVRDG